MSIACNIAGNANPPRLVAHFRPQAWVNDYAVDIDDGQEDFDATAAFLAQDLDWIKGFEEHSDDADYLAEEVSEAWKHHSGPFEVDVDADAFFEAVGLDRQALTPIDLAELRRRYGVGKPRRRKARGHKVREIVVRFVESDVKPDDIAELFTDDMPGWMAGHETVSVSRARKPTKAESESMCW
jgi:hypothetical protein